MYSSEEPSLEYIRNKIKEDLIKVLRTFRGMNNVKIKNFFELALASTGGDSFELVKHGCK